MKLQTRPGRLQYALKSHANSGMKNDIFMKTSSAVWSSWQTSGVTFVLQNLCDILSPLFVTLTMPCRNFGELLRRIILPSKGWTPARAEAYTGIRN